MSIRTGLLALVIGLASWLPSQQPVSYHGVTSATHQTQFNTLSAQGYRITSLSVAGSLSAPRYSAIWERVGGPAWLASHDMNLTQYGTFRDNCVNQGYRAKIITAAGTSAASRVFAAVFVRDGVAVVADINYPASGFADLAPVQNPTCRVQRAADRILVSADLYGDASYGPYVCAVFEPNPGKRVWGCEIDANPTEFAETRAAHADGGARLGCLGMSESQQYISVWYDDRVGTESMSWNATETGWQTFYNAQGSLSHRTIASGGSGSSLRFAGSFAQYRNPLIRTNSITGVTRSQFAALDADMQAMLVSSGARAGALAIAKDGRLLYARGYTRAESGYPITQPDDVFRIASLTKVMNAVATHEADERGHFTMTDTPAAILGLPYTADNFQYIRIRNILDYTSGIREGYSAAGIARDVNAALPISLTTGTAWLDDQPLRYVPTAYYAYSNAAWMLTAECIRVRSGSSFVTFLRDNVLSPLSITRAKVAASSRAAQGTNDAFPHLTWLRTVPTELDNTGTRVSEQFHEDLNFKRTSGGLACSAIDYVRFLSGVFELQGADAIVLDDATREYALAPLTYTSFENNQPKGICRAGMSWTDRGGGVIAYTKGGSLESASTHACWRTDGWAFAVFANVGDAPLPTGAIQSHLDAMTSWPNVDEFPNYGMPAFPQRPRIEAISPGSLNNVTTNSFLVTGKRMNTVTRVDFGSIQITSTQPGNWADGWFEVLGPTELRLHPPQGRIPTTYTVRLVNAVGTSDAQSVALTAGTSFRIGAPTTVGNQPWACVVGRGTASGLPISSSFAFLCLSPSNLPSVAPGIVSLGLGNQFSQLVITGAQSFGLLTSATRFDLPPLPSGTIYLEAIGIDAAAANPFPLLTTSTLGVTRQ